MLRGWGQTGLTIELPQTSDGRHCDYAAMLALAMRVPLLQPIPEAPPDDMPPGVPEDEREEWERAQQELAAEDEWDNPGWTWEA